MSNPPQGPVIPSGWVSRPGKTPGSTIFYPRGCTPSAPGSTYTRLMPSGSTPVPGLENCYWISVKNGQPINPVTGGTGTRGGTYPPLNRTEFSPPTKRYASHSTLTCPDSNLFVLPRKGKGLNSCLQIAMLGSGWRAGHDQEVHVLFF